MHVPPFPLIFILSLLPYLASASYVLKDDYTASSYADFFDKFTFWTDEDPTHGYVDYVSENEAWENGLIGNGGHIYLGADHVNVAEGRGRKSVRLTSRAEYDSGIVVVADVVHMPSTCGTWPALWLTSSSPSWPDQGEIDIIENANAAPNNQISIHVLNTCYINPTPPMTGSPQRFSNCAHSPTSSGCAVNDPRPNSFGHAFNFNGGGVYAMEWTSRKISVWFWPRGTYTSSVYHPFHPSPRPGEWGAPVAVYEGRDGGMGCDIRDAFKKQRIVIDTTFCGAWGNESWESSGCKAQTGFESCEAFVREKADWMGDAWWGINGLRVYSWE